MRCPWQVRSLLVDTRTPYVVDYASEYGGNTAHYMHRSVATAGEKGPWRETTGATFGVE